MVLGYLDPNVCDLLCTTDVEDEQARTELEGVSLDSSPHLPHSANQNLESKIGYLAAELQLHRQSSPQCHPHMHFLQHLHRRQCVERLVRHGPTAANVDTSQLRARPGGSETRPRHTARDSLRNALHRRVLNAFAKCDIKGGQ